MVQYERRRVPLPAPTGAALIELAHYPGAKASSIANTCGLGPTSDTSPSISGLRRVRPPRKETCFGTFAAP
jgi:hypothetical protein